LVAGAAVLVVLLAGRCTRRWPPLWRRVVPLVVLLGGAALLAVLVWQLEPLRVRVLSLVAGREDSSNNFRINVWLAVLDMIQARPWLGIGPGNDAFNLIYPLYQQPRFNALSAYSIPLELTVEAGVPGLLAGLGLVVCSLRRALGLWRGNGPWALPAMGVMAVIAALGVQGLTDTIFFRPEVQLTGWFCLATLAAAPEPD
jgi:putative inorganic carbon (hco3(-)) transporter